MGLHTEMLLQAASELAHKLTGRPVAIWLKSLRTRAVTVQGLAGFEQPMAEEVAHISTYLIADRSKQDVIVRVMTSNQEETVPDICQDLAFRGRDLTKLSESLSMLAFPIFSRGRETIGIIGLFDEVPDRLGLLDRRTLTRIADIVAARVADFRQARHLANAAGQLIRSSNLNDSTRIIAETARKLTGASSSVVWLWNAKTKQFMRTGHAAGMRWAVTPRKDGMTRSILERRRAVKIDDARTDKRIRPELVKQGIRSQIGIPIWRGVGKGTVPLGVLFVSSDKVGYFTRTDEYLLGALVGQFFAGFGWVQHLITPMDEVEAAIAHLFGLQEKLDGLCQDIQEKFGFDYVAIQLIDPLARTLETVSGTTNVDWLGAKHSMDTAPELFDIQVDVARSRPRRIEIVRGWDDRFDRWIYERFGHKDYARIWVPMLLVRGESGQLDKNWWKKADWQKGIQEPTSDGGWHSTLDLHGIKASPPRSYSLGTVDAGFRDSQKRITLKHATQLANMVSEAAFDIRNALLPSVLETIADCARHILHADSASLHFAYNPDRGEKGLFTYEVTAGKAGKDRLRFYHHNSPGHHSLWNDAIDEGRPRFTPDENRGETDEKVKRIASRLYEKGVRAIAAFPFMEDKQSVLYIYFETPHRFTGEEIHWVESFVRRAERAVQDATRALHIRNQSHQLAKLHEIAHSLVAEPESPTLLPDIAGHVASILGADVVTIYEYFALKRRFGIPPAVVGKLLNEPKVVDASIVSTPSDSVQFRAIRKLKPVYTDDNIRGKSVFRQNHPGDFIEREGIQSAIAYPLIVRGEPVGVMFINYRTRREFTDDDKDTLVPTLAASAAMAIQVAHSYRQVKQRLERQRQELDALSRIDRATAGDSSGLQEALNVILREAMEITHAPVGFIVRYDRWQNRLDMVAWHGLPAELTEGITYTSEKGIVGRCAKTGEPQFVPDVDHPDWKDIYFKIGSRTSAEIAVPLMDEDGLWGVLNIESPEPNTLSEDDLFSLDKVARQGMGAIHELAIRSRQGRQIRPLHFLSVIASRIQDPRYDTDTVHRLLLTGVTSDAGLSFSRAMLFLTDEIDSQVSVKGIMAIGAKTQEEAHGNWGKITEERKEIPENGRNIQEWVLDKAERFSRELREGTVQDDPLSLAVKGMPTVFMGATQGALTQCIKKGKSVVIRGKRSDPFRTLLKKKEYKVFPRDNGDFACVPLIGGDKKVLGAIVVDYQFLQRKWRIDDIALGNLKAYAMVAAIAIENTRLRDRMGKEREEAWRYFARQIGHSIGNRISQIEGPIFRLQDTYGEQTKGKPYIERLKAGVEETKALLRRFRELARPTDPELEEIDLGELLASVKKENHDRLGKEAIGFSIRMPERGITLMGDRHLLSDAFLELITNARKAMESEPIEEREITIRVSWESAGKSRIRIDVVNPGQGVADASKRHIFDPFYRGHGKGESQGLGLAIVKESIEAHGGTIQETGKPGRYACFSINLPCIVGNVSHNHAI